jgi:hypothetical protein
MAIQDDIMAMLSQVSNAGDKATSAGEEGKDMYRRISKLITDKDNMYAAQRELGPLFDPMQFGSLEEQMRQDPLTGGSVADIIRKYMDDAGDGVPIPSDMIVDDTRAAERMMEVLPSPETAPRTPVSVEELPPIPVRSLPGAGPGEAGMMMVDDNAAAMQGQGMDEIREERMSIPTLQRSRERLQEAQGRDITFGDDFSRRDLEAAETDYNNLLQRLVIEGGEKEARQEGVYGSQAARIRAAAGENTGLSGIELAGRTGREATPEDEVSAILNSLVYGGAPIGGIAAVSSGVLSRLAMRLGIGRISPQELARNPVVRKQIEQQIRLALPKPTPGAPSSYVAPASRVGARSPRQLDAASAARAAGRGEKTGPAIRIDPSPAQRLGSTQGSGSRIDQIINSGGSIGMDRGGAVRNNIMNTYAMMAEGGSGADATDETVYQQMRRLKSDFGKDKAVRMMREIHPDYQFSESGLVIPPGDPSNRDLYSDNVNQLGVNNAPIELLRNYLRNK